MTAVAMSDLETRLTRATRPDRLFTDEAEAQRLVGMLRRFSGCKYGVIVDSADRNVNSEQARFSRQFTKILQVAGWAHADLPMLPLWSPTSNRGVLIGYRSDSAYSKAAFSELVSDLAEFGIQSSGDPVSDLDEHTFIFEVGTQ